MEILNAVYVFLIQWDIPIYFLAAAGFLINVLRLWYSRRQLKRAMFTVEQEQGRGLRTAAVGGMFLFAVMFSTVLYVNLQVAPTLPPELLLPPTPPPNIFATPLSSPTPEGDDLAGTVRPRVTPNLVATATLPGNLAGESAETPLPTNTRPPSVPATGEVFIPEGGGCTPGVNISFPRQNMTVFGTVEYIGTAVDESFGAYELEMRGPGTGNEWVNVIGGRSFVPVSNDVLGTVNLGVLENGTYNVRLTIVDADGSLNARCTIAIEVNNE
ncbi:MAG: hypothetical protein QNJ45_25590 [Ardenticatenaceae bacterium]|nr:hypothetical protein [Ardenticatenaceae bacterium]